MPSKTSLKNEAIAALRLSAEACWPTPRENVQLPLGRTGGPVADQPCAARRAPALLRHCLGGNGEASLSGSLTPAADPPGPGHRPAAAILWSAKRCGLGSSWDGVSAGAQPGSTRHRLTMGTQALPLVPAKLLLAVVQEGPQWCWAAPISCNFLSLCLYLQRSAGDQTSMFAALSALVSMNSRRGSTSSPISIVNTRSASIASSI